MSSSNPILDRLAHYVTFSKNNSRDDLIINALHNSNQFMSKNDIKQYIESVYGCIISNSELINRLMDLKEKKLVIEATAGNYLLSDEVSNVLMKLQDDFGSLEKLVMNEWASELLKKYDLNDSELNLLQENIIHFCNSFFYFHGVESMNFISNKFKEHENDFEIDRIIDSLNIQNIKLTKIAQEEFRSFITSSNKHYFSYLRALLNRAIGYLTEICDPQTIEVLRNNLNIKILYLDTNIIFRLIDLQGEERKESILEVLNLCKQHNIEVRITKRTLVELQNSISRYAQLLLKYPLPSDISRIAYKYRNSENYFSAYWRELSINGITPADFNSRYRNVDLIIKNLGIAIEDTTWFEQEIIEMKSELTSKFQLYLSDNRIDHRSYSVIEHDAYHLAFIHYLQGSPVARFSDAESFFLTSDRWLVNFQSNLHLLKDSSAPLSLRPTNIVNIFQFITPINGDYAETFLNFFTNHKYIPTKINNELIQEIASKVASSKYSPALFENIITNEHITSRYSSFSDDVEKQKFIEWAIDDEIEKMAEDLSIEKEKASKLQNELLDKSQKESQLQNKVYDALDEVSAAKEETERLRTQLKISEDIIENYARKRENWKRFFTILLVLILFSFIVVDYYILGEKLEKFIRYMLFLVVLTINSLVYYFYLLRKGILYCIPIIIGLYTIYFTL